MQPKVNKLAKPWASYINNIKFYKSNIYVKGDHFIDTSVLASLLYNDSEERECLRYLKRIPHIYKGSISLLVLGELYLSFFINYTGEFSGTKLFEII